MSALSEFGVEDPALVGAVVAGGLLLLVPLLWLMWRQPTAIFLFALASLAVRPQVIFGGPEVGYEWGVHHTLLVLALIANALRYGVHRIVNWPILALGAVFVLNLLFGRLHPDLTVGFMLTSLAILALPWSFTQVPMAPGSRRTYALVIGLTPLISVGVGGALQIAGIAGMFGYEEWNGVYRLKGATGNPAALALLAFAGFAAMLHESTRRHRPYAGYLAAINLTVVVLTGTRMPVVASVVLVVAYLLISSDFRGLWRQHRVAVLFAACIAAVTLALYVPSLYHRTFSGHEADIAVSGRDLIWGLYFTEFLESPVFGRGIGAGFIAATDWVPWPRKTPHNEYLHVLVSGGIIGSALVFAAIASWCRGLLQVASANDREFLLAMLPALAVLAITEDVLIFSTGLALFAYLTVPLTLPAPHFARRPMVMRPSGVQVPREARPIRYEGG